MAKPVYLKFKAKIDIIGVNPFVFLPEKILHVLFIQSNATKQPNVNKANVTKGKIPVKMKIDGNEFTQTLVKYSGAWRLYLNTPMRMAAGKDVGDTAVFEIKFNKSKPHFPDYPALLKALNSEPEALKVFLSLPPSRRLEINRYLSRLISKEAIERNLKRAVDFLKGKTRFIGRNKP